jgi:hypothetical protein
VDAHDLVGATRVAVDCARGHAGSASEQRIDDHRHHLGARRRRGRTEEQLVHPGLMPAIEGDATHSVGQRGGALLRRQIGARQQGTHARRGDRLAARVEVAHLRFLRIGQRGRGRARGEQPRQEQGEQQRPSHGAGG